MSVPEEQLQVQEPPQQLPPPTPNVMLGESTIRYLMERSDIPEGVRMRFWVWASNDLMLSNITVEMANQIMAGFDFSLLLYLNDAGEEMDYRVLQWLSDLRVSVILSLMRSTGNEERERKIIATGYQEVSSSYNEQVGQKKTGMIGKLRK